MPTTNGTADRRQPETITVVQVLLVLTAVVSALGLLVSIVVAVAVSTIVDRLSGLPGATGLGGAGPAAGTTGRVTTGLVLGTLEVLLVVAVAVWAFRAVGRANPYARPVLGVTAAVQAVLTLGVAASAGANGAMMVLAVVAGLLVFDAPILLLLWAPVASRHWFDGAGPGVASGGMAPVATYRTPPIPGPVVTPVAPMVPAVPAARGPVSGPLPRVTDEDPVTIGLVLPRDPAGRSVSTPSGRHAVVEREAAP